MQNLIENLRKNAEPVHHKCLGLGLTKEEQECVVAPRCSKIEPLPIFDLIDEETGQADAEVDAVYTVEDPECRCTVYFRPKVKWNNGKCPMADHVVLKDDLKKSKVRVGQQKQKKK